MEKKNLSMVILIFCAGLLLMPGKAHALPGFISLFTTDAPGSTTLKNVFDPGQTPYLYMNLEIPGGATASTLSFWNDPDNVAWFGGNTLGTDTELWSTLTDWNTAQKTGTWTINANYFDNKGNNDVASTNLTVTPEPATLGLVLMGGIPMFLRRRKTAV